MQVEGLAGCRVLHVACGVWHTAAVAAHMPGFESLQQQGSAEVDLAEWQAIQQKMADAYDALDEVRNGSVVPCMALLSNTSAYARAPPMPVSSRFCLVRC